MTEAEKRQIATTFIEGLRKQDANLLNGIMTPDVIWSIPGRRSSLAKRAA
jgi:hypothetical protein